MRYLNSVVLLATLAAPPLFAQAAATIDPGMTQAQVIERLGKPLSSRSYGSFTYMLFQNGCERKCGMNDLVVLDSDKVVDAIFRAKTRKYSGTSSSPQMISAATARGAGKTKGDLKMPPAAPKKPEG